MQFKDLMKRQGDVVKDAAARQQTPGPGRSVIIAEKERAAREAIADQVIALGYLPLIAEQGERAIQLATQHIPRLVLANLELEGLGGREVLDALRKDDATRHIPVMLISNTDKTPDMVAGKQVGADDYICKPINGTEVKARIRKLLLKTAAKVPAPPPATGPPPTAPHIQPIPVEPILAGAIPPLSPPSPPPPPPPPDHIGRAEKVYEQCCDFARDAMTRAAADDPPDIDWCRDLASRLVEECDASNRLLLKAIRPYEPGESSHDAVNVAVFSVKIGRGLNYDSEELTALAMAALCHEVGMTCVPPDVASAGGKYSRKQWNQIRRHPEHAHHILSKLGDKYEWLARAVFEEHERERGQGYPRGLTGDEICDFAKIIGLADTYEALSHRRAFRKAFIAFDALREIIGMRNTYFPPHIIRALVSEVSVFPLESYVRLNTGEVARVVRTNPDNLLRPVAVVERDPSGNKLRRPKIVDLATRPLIYVTQPVDERDLV